MKQSSVSDCNLEAWIWNSKASPWFHLLILCFHHTLQGDMKWRRAWKELTEGGGSMWWHDHGLSALACCVHAWLCVCVCFSVCVLWIELGSDTRVLCPMPPTSLLLLNWCPRRIPPRPWKVGLHLNKFSNNCPRSVTFYQPQCLADW